MMDIGQWGASMDQLVFVHGVATRKGADYDRQVRNRDTLFRKAAWKGKPVNIRNPYWGDWGAAFSHDLECLPGKGPKAVAFGLGSNAAPAPASDIQQLAALAKTDFGAAVDAIFVAMMEQAEADGSALTPEQIAQFAAAGDYAMHNAQWAEDASFDQTIVDELRKRVAPAGPARFGLGDAIGAAAQDIVDRARNLAARGLAPLIRDGQSPAIAVFLGDVFTYLYGSGGASKRSSIRQCHCGRPPRSHAGRQGSGRPGGGDRPQPGGRHPLRHAGRPRSRTRRCRG
jgi:hypothetical protein